MVEVPVEKVLGHLSKRVQEGLLASALTCSLSACKAAERGDAVVSLSEANTADGNSGKPFGEM